MGDQNLKWSEPGSRIWAGAGLMLLIFVVTFGLTVVSRDGSGQHPATTTATPSPPDDVEVHDTASLTVPQTVRAASDTFDSAEGQSYLLRFDVSTTKPEDTPGEAMYMVVSLSCAGEDGRGTGSAGGTQNLIAGEPTTLRNQFVLVGDGQQQSCNISVSAPNPEVAAAGTTVELDVRWTAAPIDGRSFEVESAERLPMSVQVDNRELVFSRTIDLESMRGQRLEISSTLHLTACTGLNGSREEGRIWCDAATIEEKGSEVGLFLRVDLLDTDGRPCDEIDVQSASLHIDKLTHHRLVNIALDTIVPVEACGSSLRVSLTVAAQGPAPVVVHSLASSLVVEIREDVTGDPGETA